MRWMGWRLRLLVLLALLGCLGLFLLARDTAMAPQVQAAWRASPGGGIELHDSADPRLQGRIGSRLVELARDDRRVVFDDALALQRSARWLIDDDRRERLSRLHRELAEILAGPSVTLAFEGGARVELAPKPLGLAALPPLFWVFELFALALYLVAMVVLLARPSVRHLLFAVIALCQAGNLVFIAVESVPSLYLPRPFSTLDAPLRMAFDLLTAAAIVDAVARHPKRLPGASGMAAAAWSLALVLSALAADGHLAHLWWWTQGSIVFVGLAVIGLMSWSYRLEPHPVTMLLRRFAVATVVTWVLLSASLAAAERLPQLNPNIATIGSMVWYVFFASLMLLVPFLSKTQQVMREFALLAAVSTVATSLDLLFVAVFSLGQFASLTLSLFLSLAVYSGARQWIVNQLLGSSILTTERIFEQLYRIAREVEIHPERTSDLLATLLREVFEPLELRRVERSASTSRLLDDGSTLLVPLPALGAQAVPTVMMLRFARRGRRLFTLEDARLTDRIVEQLRRAVAFDMAVEQGRNEERLRLAQDLHDDIGARLLTLMYTAQSPEMEEYVRHTLQDLKTLTRGLAAANHRLSHAAAEWKADLSQRLTAAHIELGWRFEFDDDLTLSVVRWSALTRVLRELVSNAIAHAQATRVDVEITLARDRLDLDVSDDGLGHNPAAWSHGLGLGGVRKRVKQLGGEVAWREITPRGIGCHVTIRELSSRV